MLVDFTNTNLAFGLIRIERTLKPKRRNGAPIGVRSTPTLRRERGEFTENCEMSIPGVANSNRLVTSTSEFSQVAAIDKKKIK